MEPIRFVLHWKRIATYRAALETHSNVPFTSLFPWLVHSERRKKAMEDELDAILSQLNYDDLSFFDAPFVLSTDSAPSANHAAVDSASSARSTHARARVRADFSAPSSHEPPPPNQPHPTTIARFGELKTDADVEEARKKAIPKKNTSWALNIWKQWSSHRRQVCTSYNDWPTHLMIAQPSELNYWLSKFVLEVKKGNGEQYLPDTLYSVCTGLLRFIRETRPEINIFKDPMFSGFQRTLDSEMKRLRSLGLGVKRKQAEPITIAEENQLWERGFLGDSSPQVLLDTMLFLCGVHFALRSGEEHRSLQLSQFELVSPSNADAYLVYTENYSKNNQGGLQHRKVKPKSVTCYANKQDPTRCLVRLFQEYLRHHPKDIQCFYLTPLRKMKNNVWYSKMPVGHNTLSRTVGCLCEQAGISGFKTNHSLRVTSATRLFQSGVDEQLIMSHTGHRSVDGVRSYKRISEEQKKAVSNVLASASSGLQQADDQPSSSKRMKVTTSTDSHTSVPSPHNNISSANTFKPHPYPVLIMHSRFYFYMLFIYYYNYHQ